MKGVSSLIRVSGFIGLVGMVTVAVLCLAIIPSSSYSQDAKGTSWADKVKAEKEAYKESLQKYKEAYRKAIADWRNTIESRKKVQEQKKEQQRQQLEKQVEEKKIDKTWDEIKKQVLDNWEKTNIEESSIYITETDIAEDFIVKTDIDKMNQSLQVMAVARGDDIEKAKEEVKNRAFETIFLYYLTGLKIKEGHYLKDVFIAKHYPKDEKRVKDYFLRNIKIDVLTGSLLTDNSAFAVTAMVLPVGKQLDKMLLELDYEELKPEGYKAKKADLSQYTPQPKVEKSAPLEPTPEPEPVGDTAMATRPGVEPTKRKQEAIKPEEEDKPMKPPEAEDVASISTSTEKKPSYYTTMEVIKPDISHEQATGGPFFGVIIDARDIGFDWRKTFDICSDDMVIYSKFDRGTNAIANPDLDFVQWYTSLEQAKQDAAGKNFLVVKAQSPPKDESNDLYISSQDAMKILSANTNYNFLRENAVCVVTR